MRDALVPEVVALLERDAYDVEMIALEREVATGVEVGVEDAEKDVDAVREEKEEVESEEDEEERPLYEENQRMLARVVSEWRKARDEKERKKVNAFLWFGFVFTLPRYIAYGVRDRVEYKGIGSAGVGRRRADVYIFSLDRICLFAWIVLHCIGSVPCTIDTLELQLNILPCINRHSRRSKDAPRDLTP